MKKEIADKWIAALRSGKYKQTVGVLNSPNEGMCCLGILCEISKLTEWEKSKTLPYADKYMNELKVLPKEVQKWAGLISHNGEFGNGLALSAENDKGKTFSQIATIIETEWESL